MRSTPQLFRRYLASRVSEQSTALSRWLSLLDRASCSCPVTMQQSYSHTQLTPRTQNNNNNNAPCSTLLHLTHTIYFIHFFRISRSLAHDLAAVPRTPSHSALRDAPIPFTAIVYRGNRVRHQ